MQNGSPPVGAKSRSVSGVVPDAPGALPSKWSYEIEQSMPETEAVAVILGTLVDVMVANEKGVCQRLDEEYLHDYRVAVRRTRSALSLFKEVLPSEMLRRGRAFFKDLGKRTNEARDLDVLGLALPVYAESLGSSGRSGLEAIEVGIAVRIDKEYDGIRSWLESEAYERGVTDWRSEMQRLLATPAVGEISGRAAEAIRKAALGAGHQIEEIGRADTRVNVDAAIHRLRIRFKKLRYALEFSRSLTPGGEVEHFIGTLKQLQDELGAYQDLAVHRRRIVTIGRTGASADETGDLLAKHLAVRMSGLRDVIRSKVAGFGQATEVELDRVLAALA